MGRPQPTTAYGKWQTAQLQRVGKSQAEMHRETGIREGVLSKWKLGREVPAEHWRQKLADYFGVTPETVPLGFDANADVVAQKIAAVPTETVQIGVGSSPVTDTGKSASGQEVRFMSEWARKTGHLVESMADEETQKAAHLALQTWWAETLLGAKDPPTGRSLSRKRR